MISAVARSATSARSSNASPSCCSDVGTLLATARSHSGTGGVVGLAVQRLAEHRHLGRQGGGVERDGVRQDDRVRIGVHEVERAAQHVADLVMERGRRGAERDARQVRAVQQSCPAAGIAWLGHDGRQGAVDGAHALHRQHAGDRVGAGRVQRLDAVGQGVERRRTGDAEAAGRTSARGRRRTVRGCTIGFLPVCL